MNYLLVVALGVGLLLVMLNSSLVFPLGGLILIYALLKTRKAHIKKYLVIHTALLLSLGSWALVIFAAKYALKIKGLWMVSMLAIFSMLIKFYNSPATASGFDVVTFDYNTVWGSMLWLQALCVFSLQFAFRKLFVKLEEKKVEVKTEDKSEIKNEVPETSEDELNVLAKQGIKLKQKIEQPIMQKNLEPEVARFSYFSKLGEKIDNIIRGD